MLPSTDLKTSAPRINAFSVLNRPAHSYRYRRFACPLAGTDARLAEKRGLVTPSFQGTCTPYLLPVRLAHQTRTCPAQHRGLQDAGGAAPKSRRCIVHGGAGRYRLRAASRPHRNPSGRSVLMFVLDTNVISELRKVGDGKADARVAAWVSGRGAASFDISALTLMELEIGILRIERRDPEQGDRLRTWMDRHVLPECLGRTLPVDSAVALKCARLHVPDPRDSSRTGRVDRCNRHSAWDDGRHGKPGRLRSSRQRPRLPRALHPQDRNRWTIEPALRQLQASIPE